MVTRYELSETQWRRIAGLLPGKTSDPGRTGVDNRLFVNGVLWVLRSGTAECGGHGARPIRWSWNIGRSAKVDTAKLRKNTT